MIKLIIKLALAALIANATWHIGTAYLSYYRLKDAAREAALTPRINDDQLRDRVIDLASENDVPLDPDSVEIRRDKTHIYIDASYAQRVEVLPGYQYDWPFSWSVEAYLVPGAAGVAPER
jgi:hypothetical protein